MRTRLTRLGPFCLLILAASGCAHTAGSPPDAKGAAATEQTAPAIEVVVGQAQEIVWPRLVHVQGNLLSDERVTVGAKVAGRVADLGQDANGRPVDLGSPIRAGDVLTRLETDELELKVQQAASQLDQVRATLGIGKDQDDSQLDPAQVPTVLQEKALWEAAQDNWNRAKALERETAISAEEVQQRKSLMDVAAARYKSALHSVNESLALLGVRRAELALARQALEDAEIRAPFDGVVEQRFVAPGAYVQVGAAVMTLVKVNPWRFRGTIPEREAAAVRVGQRVTIQIEGEPQPLEATLVRISPSVEVSNRSLTFEAMQPASTAGASDQAAASTALLRRGLFAEADIHVDPEARTLAVPRAAVREFAGVEKVWRVVEGQAAEQPVTVGRQNDTHAEILDGIAAGDVVVVENWPKRAGPVVVTGSKP